jgi:hypothetical protein
MPFTDNDVKYEAGDKWILLGPTTYVPRQEVAKIKKQNAAIIERDCGILLECIKETDDKKAG